MIKRLLTAMLGLTTLTSSAQNGVYNTLNVESLTKSDGAAGFYGWGQAYNNTLDPRPNWRPDAVPYIINHHTGLTFSAHSNYGGIRFYNQGYPGIYDSANGATLVMSVTGGSVGIGVPSPQQKLDVSGNVFLRGAGAYAYNNPGAGELHLGYGIAAAGTSGVVTRLAIQPYGHTGGPWKIDSRDSQSSAYMDIHYGTGVGVTIVHTGDVGIGTTSPDAKLSVKGRVHAEEVKVDLSVPGPDYVFAERYKLPTLAETEAYIKAHKHLPDVPSASQMEKQGIRLGEMNIMLLKKVEELTLHLIRVQKELDKIKGRVKTKITKPI